MAMYNMITYADLLSERTNEQLDETEQLLAVDFNFLVLTANANNKLVLQGAVNKQIDALGGTTIYLVPNQELKGNVEILSVETDRDEIVEYRNMGIPMHEIILKWHDTDVWQVGGYHWTFRTNIPCAKFNIRKEKNLYCQGIVINTKQL